MATSTSMAASSFTNDKTIKIPLLALLSVLFPAAQVAGEPPNVVPIVCKDAYAVGGGSFTVEFCMSALEGHSAGATYSADLALIAVDLVTKNATATEAQIDALLGGGGDLSLLEGLRWCRTLYDTVVRQYQPDCPTAVKDGRYAEGKACLRRTAQVAAECERWFQQRKMASPVARDDDNLAMLANLAIALASIA